MLTVTLHESDRYKSLNDIPEPRATQLRIVQQANPGVEREDLPVSMPLTSAI